eukprot:Gb_18345 [translate_table: standard]
MSVVGLQILCNIKVVKVGSQQRPRIKVQSGMAYSCRPTTNEVELKVALVEHLCCAFTLTEKLYIPVAAVEDRVVFISSKEETVQKPSAAEHALLRATTILFDVVLAILSMLTDLLA